MKLIKIICFIILLVPNNAISKKSDCQDLFGVNIAENFTVQQVDSLCNCIWVQLIKWYSPSYDNDALFTFFKSTHNLKGFRESTRFGKLIDSALKTTKIDARVKCAILLYFNENTINIGHFISSKNLAKLTFVLDKKNSSNFNEDSLVNILNKSTLNEILFFLDNVAYLNAKVFKQTIGRIDKIRFSNTPSKDEGYSDRDVLQMTIDATYGQLEEEPDRNKR